jgi:tricorn protease
MKKLNMVLFILAVAAITTSALAQDETRLLRFPAIHGDRIVFTYAGDLYTVSASGGVARKITNDVGYEMFARFSPDGSKLAFTGQYDGNTEVYVMPADGGVPKRLSFTATLDRDDVSDRMGPNNIVMCWKDNEHIVFRSRMSEFNDFKGQLYSVAIDGSMPEQLPMPRGGFCSFSPEQDKLAYNRVFREFRTWKRYRGGQADEIWVYDFNTHKTINITDNPAQDIIPMWAGNRIYFLSDRDENKKLNLFVYDLTTHETRQITRFDYYDCKFPSIGENAIVFENGGYIYKLDLATEKYDKVPIYLHEDFVSGRGGLVDLSKSVSNYEISPDGNRALFGARGDVFTVPAKYGNGRNLTQSPGIHERNSKWSPDGKWIAFVSDESGEDEIWMMPQDGKGKKEQLTKGGDTYKYQLLWSPDSKKIMWADKKLRLQVVDIETKKTTIVDEGKMWEFTRYAWSPDSKWITYAKDEIEGTTRIYIRGIDGKESMAVTDEWFDSGSPIFSSDGKYLFFVSNRTFNPIYGQTEWNHIYLDMSKIYLLTLAKDTKSPFEPKSDEVKIAEESKPEGEKSGKADKKKDDDKDKEKKVVVKIDFEGINNRITVLPVTAANYDNLQSVGEKLYYVRAGNREGKPKLFLFDLSKQKETELGDIRGYEISADGKKMLVGQDDFYAIIDLPTGKIEVKDKLNLSDLKVQLDRRAEWHQIFVECWRQMRDFFFDPQLHHVDWKAIREKYEPLVEFVNHRTDLTYVIGEMIGELSAGHCYVGGGEYPKPKRIAQGLLGAKIVKDGKFFKIVEILRGQNWENRVRSPLTEIGVNVKEGEYILAIDGVSTETMTNISAALVNTAGRQVKLRVNASPKEQGSREITVVPIDDERPLYYYTWVQKNIEKVTKATEGKIGYVHIPDMGASGLNEFVKYYYPQLRKGGLIVDVRGNGGGNVSPQIIERLRRQIAMITIARNTIGSPEPGGTVVGPKVALIDEFSASDGDIFAYRFKKYNLGRVVGKRTWGGVVGIRGTMPLLDGGHLYRPEFSRYDTEGKEWIIEGVGVEPTDFVDNDPWEEFNGNDQQLSKAIEIVLEELKQHPVKLPEPPPSPDKRK